MSLMMTRAQKHGCKREFVDEYVKDTVKKIFEDLRRHQPMMRTRKSDHANTGRMLRERNERNSKRR